jgi:hypothetical protein
MPVIMSTSASSDAIQEMVCPHAPFINPCKLSSRNTPIHPRTQSKVVVSLSSNASLINSFQSKLLRPVYSRTEIQSQIHMHGKNCGTCTGKICVRIISYAMRHKTMRENSSVASLPHQSESPPTQEFSAHSFGV